ncbi:Acetylornithine deacetylase/Succinyl-diaminopimelate desuccinylase [Desulfacinum hydrothermale DSM 13146]|uniref:Acetylornithine deacetylase/Succinyl-diaminopimelate desuccinylase n=1 Tax=Desulfacinum hydrothermale DSM 13146 TaxID=1121390 RepID=A0A1W1X9J1_9BACT|nr:dipeptidase [Desulfacinum hydrothermale]SMC20490.1 Acetylornithine deacetylase/Succinyl-diaminopimelate desuccinylase [Desulfacinum hydrothermale DSM 13146]
MNLNDIFEKIDSNHERYVQELVELLSIPSVSTYSHHKGDVQRAGEWIAAMCQRLGLDARLYPTDGHPVILASHCPHADRPTLLIYGHYDVQPPEPVDEWVTPPFSPTVRDGFVYARGASDDKGQVFTYLKAIEALMAVRGELPINVKLLVEGEEEIGSPHLGAFLGQHKKLLQADAIAISDGAQFAPDVPAITYGLRGLAYMQLDVTGPRVDLHSGSFGGLVMNPIQALSTILCSLKTDGDRVAIDGFYDQVVDLAQWERKAMAELPLDVDQLQEYLGVEDLYGEDGYSPLERKTARPTLDINGVWGGFAGEGAKTVIPSKAGAKVSMRLVPNQDPDRIAELFRAHVAKVCPAGVQVKVTHLHSAKPVLVSRDLAQVQAAARAIRTGFGKDPVFIREGGSIPIVNLFKEELGLEAILLLGWGRPDDGAHSPNERFSLEDFRKGIRSAVALFHELAGEQP